LVIVKLVETWGQRGRPLLARLLEKVFAIPRKRFCDSENVRANLAEKHLQDVAPSKGFHIRFETWRYVLL
jgi:hypothetical protein